MSIPLIIFAGIYFILFLVWVLWTLFNVYHVFRYAYWTKLPLIMVFVYLGFSVAVIAITGWSIKDVNWTETFSITGPTIDSSTPTLDGITNLLPK